MTGTDMHRMDEVRGDGRREVPRSSCGIGASRKLTNLTCSTSYSLCADPLRAQPAPGPRPVRALPLSYEVMSRPVLVEHRANGDLDRGGACRRSTETRPIIKPDPSRAVGGEKTGYHPKDCRGSAVACAA